VGSESSSGAVVDGVVWYHLEGKNIEPRELRLYWGRGGSDGSQGENRCLFDERVGVSLAEGGGMGMYQRKLSTQNFLGGEEVGRVSNNATSPPSCPASARYCHFLRMGVSFDGVFLV